MTKKQHFLVKKSAADKKSSLFQLFINLLDIKSAADEKSSLFQLFINLLDIVKIKSDLAVPRCVLFFSTEVVFISLIVSLP